MPQINRSVLVSGADYFTNKDAINALMDPAKSVNNSKAKKEHDELTQALKSASIKVTKVNPPADCQDGIYTANWGLVRNGQVVLSRLPNKRKPEEAYAKQVLGKLGLKTIELPKEVKAFSGQGDSLACNDILFCHSPYRTSENAHKWLKHYLGFKLIALKTKPKRLFKIGPAKRNRLTGWIDSPTYDLDLALAIIKPGTSSSLPLIAYCPRVFCRSSRHLLKNLGGFDKIVVSRREAIDAFATNLVSTGEEVIMNTGAPKLKAELIKHGLKVTELYLPELKKGGGSIRCSTLTLD